MHHAGTNNFDCVRLLAALAVMYSHQVKLTDRGIVAVSAYHDLGKMGVLVFFAISGYLVMQSWERDPHLGRFLARRLLRIWPGLACVMLLTLLVLGPALTTLPLAEYFRSPQTWDFASHLWFVVGEQQLPGVFVGHAIERVNGPLWTIPLEMGWYVVLAALGVAGLLRYGFAVPVVTVACALYLFGVYGAERPGVERWWPMEFGLFFLYGACMHAGRRLWQPRPWRAALAAVALAGVAWALGHDYVAIWLALPCLTVLAAQASTPLVRDAGRLGDFSYGIYIYSFPVQQTVIWLTANALGLWSGMALSLAVTMVFAWASWRFVEQPALGWKRLLRPADKRTENSAGPAGTARV